MLLGLSDIKRSSISELLKSQGVTKNNILKALKEVRGSNRVTGQNPEDTYQSLMKYGKNLNDLAKKGKLDPGNREGR